MTDQELIQALNRLKVETGSLACLGCGHEHNCGIHGCAIIRGAADRLTAVLGEMEQVKLEREHVGNGVYVLNHDYVEAAHRLAAYEDTGLEPEEIAKIRENVENGYLKSSTRRYGIPVDRLRELARADREGRCVVMPCTAKGESHETDPV